MLKYWLYLLVAIVFEVFGTVSMKQSLGFTKLIPSILIFVFYGIAFTFLTLSLKQLDVGLAYAIWAGLGTALIALIGVLFFREALSLIQVGCIALIIAGVVGLKITSLHQ